MGCNADLLGGGPKTPCVCAGHTPVTVLTIVFELLLVAVPVLTHAAQAQFESTSCCVIFNIIRFIYYLNSHTNPL